MDNKVATVTFSFWIMKVCATLLLKFKGDRSARNYSVECSLSTEGLWEDKGLTTTRVMLDSLSPGKTCWARTCANGSAGPSEWSVPTVMMAV